MDNPHPIYPSQTDTLKSRARDFAEHIAKATNTKTLSAFKRNDWISQALGYKGHTDLLKSTRFRKQSDQNQPLALFSDNALRLKIVDVFLQRTGISNEVLSKCSKQVAEHEGILNNAYPGVSIPLSNTDPSHKLVDLILKSDITFLKGPSATGKSRLAKVMDETEIIFDGKLDTDWSGHSHKSLSLLKELISSTNKKVVAIDEPFSIFDIQLELIKTAIEHNKKVLIISQDELGLDKQIIDYTRTVELKINEITLLPFDKRQGEFYQCFTTVDNGFQADKSSKYLQANGLATRTKQLGHAIYQITKIDSGEQYHYIQTSLEPRFITFMLHFTNAMPINLDPDLRALGSTFSTTQLELFDLQKDTHLHDLFDGVPCFSLDIDSLPPMAERGAFSEFRWRVIKIMLQVQAALGIEISEAHLWFDWSNFSKVVDKLESQGTHSELVEQAKGILAHDRAYFNKILACLIPSMTLYNSLLKPITS